MNTLKPQDPSAETAAASPDAALILLIGEFNEIHAQAKIDSSTKLWRHTGTLANQISATPAQTFEGVFKKLQIVRLVTGDDIDSAGADETLATYQTKSDEPWFASAMDETWFAGVMSDFERLIGQAGDDDVAGARRHHPYTAQTADDPFPALLMDWEAACAAWGAGAQTEELDAPVQAAEHKIIDTPTRTIVGVVAKLKLLACLVAAGHEPSDDLAISALKGAQAVMRGSGVVGNATAGPDPFVALLAEWNAALAIYDAYDGGDDAISSKLDEAVVAIEAKITGTPSETLAGAFAKLKVMTNCMIRGMAPEDEGVLDTLSAAGAVMRSIPVAAMGGKRGETFPDPFVYLAKGYVAAEHAFKGDKEHKNYWAEIMTPLEQQLAKLRPISREGVVAALDLVLQEQHLDLPGDGPSCWTEEYVVGLLQNARSAVDTGQWDVPAAPDPLVARWAEWYALEFGRVPEGLTTEEGDSFTSRQTAEADDISIEIVSATPETVLGCYAQFEIFHNWDQLNASVRGRAALAGLFNRAETALHGAIARQGATS